MDTTMGIYIFGFLLFLFIIVHYFRKFRSTVNKVSEEPKRIRSQCPDYWIVEGDKKCRNVHKLGRCLTKGTEGGMMDFDTEYFNNKDTGNYAKCRWAKKCHVAWDGIDHICI